MLMINEARLNILSKQDIDMFIDTYGKEPLNKSLVSITQNSSDIKKITGANNYTSLAVYWHPNPDTPDGYPYIRKDGTRNTHASKISDSYFLSELIRQVSIAAFIYRFNKSQEYCSKAIEFIRYFFLMEDSKMNPDLTYSGIVIGENKSDLKIRGATIDTQRLPYIIDMISILRENPYWTDNDENGIKLWFGKLAGWFKNSPRGKIQSGYYHNIKTSYMLQFASYLFAAGEEEEARTYLKENVKEVLSKQISPDGQQPLEMERVNKRNYCDFNLILLCNLAKVCSNLGIDIWDYSDEQGRGSIRKAMVHMATFYAHPEKWTYTDETRNSATTRAWLENGVSLYNDQILHDVYKQVRIYNFCNVFEYTLAADRKGNLPLSWDKIN